MRDGDRWIRRNVKAAAAVLDQRRAFGLGSPLPPLVKAPPFILQCVGLGRPELPPARAAGAVNPIRRVGVGQESVGELWRQGTVRVGQQGGAVLYRELRENHREIVVSHGSGRYASLATGSGDGLRRRARRASHPAVPDARIRCVPPHSQGLRGRCR